MKQLFSFVIATIFCVHFVHGQSHINTGLKVNKSTLIQNDEVTFSINTDEIGANTIQPMFAIFMPMVAGNFTASDKQMICKNNDCQVSFKIPPGADALSVRFIQGKKTFNNNEKGYFYQVYNKNGNPITDSYFSLKVIHGGNYALGVYKGDTQKSNEYFEKWKANMDINKLSFNAKALYYYNIKDSIQLSSHLSGLPQQNKLSKNDFDDFFRYSRYLTADAVSVLNNTYNKLFPFEKELNDINTKIRNAADFDTKYSLTQNLLHTAFKDSVYYHPTIDAILSHLGSTAAKNVNLTQMLKFNDITPKNSGYEDNVIGFNRNYLNACFAKDSLIKESKIIAENMANLAASNKPLASKLKNWETEQIKWQQIRSIQNITDGVIAEYHFKTGQPKLALPLIVKTAQFFDYELVKVNGFLIDVLEANGEKDKIGEHMKAIFIAGAYDDKLLQKFKSENKDAESLLESYRADRVKNLKQKIRHKMLEIPLGDYNLTINNKVVNKSELKGKVVFIDFWATWCGPCVKSFPAMQRFSDANKMNADYKILFVNTLQGKMDRVKEVEKFLQKNPYTFQIAYDLDDSAAKTFGVTGLPTKAIVDRNGIIRFVSMGTGENENKAIEELQAMMDLANEASALPGLNGAVRMKGKLLNFQSLEKIEDLSEFQYLKPTSDDRLINTDAEGNFDVTFKLDEPNYFRIGRNILYLTPGDNLEVVLDKNVFENSTFKGIGSEANDYLKKTPFPKAGSFLEAGANINPDPFSTYKKINELVDERYTKLAMLSNVTEEFKRLERAHIKADLINSLERFQPYTFHLNKKMSKDSLDRVLNLYAEVSKLFLKPLKSDFLDASVLKVAVYRDIVNKLITEPTSKPDELAKINEWLETSKISAKIEKGVTNDELDELKKSIHSLKNDEYRKILMDKLDVKSNFNTGSIAADFTVTDVKGQEVKLSSLKGKTIYIDIWATWCGPCMGEMPHLRKLKEEFKRNKNVAIVSLSIDDNKNAWLKYLEKNNDAEGIQWLINRLKLDAYSLVGVPRYILIDKNFRIVDMNAPAPSDSKLKTLILSI